MSRPRSLRERLQSTTFLAVLAGYGVLLLLNLALSGWQRRDAHAQLAAELRQTQDQGALLPREGMARELPGGIEVRLVAELTARPAQLERLGERVWMESRLPAMDGQGRTVGLVVRQDVTAALATERRGQWLLVAVAGFSSLVTSTLLRPVLRDGLRDPLAVLSQAVAALPESPSTPVNIEVVNQPEELQPIASAFNTLQERLAVAWRQQRTFIDGVAHELRTPLSLISGYSQRLERLLPADADEPLRQASREIRSESERMGRLVRDLLDLARQEGERLELRVQELDAADQLLGSYERLQPLAAGRLRLLPPADHEDLTIRADPDRLDQCLTNLVENALAYSPSTEPVELSVVRWGDAVAMCVRDHGPGVPPQDRERIFDLFARGSSAQSVHHSGSGLGLAMVRLLMERMGGQVRLAEAVGEGAEFQLVLPALASAQQQPVNSAG